MPVPDPAARLLRLLSLLQRRPRWGGPELAERLGVTTRTLRRDIDRLRSLGYPVDAEPGRGGGYRLEPGGSMPPLLLDDDEATAVAIALRSTAGSAVSGIDDAALAALSKLDRVLPPHLRARVDALRETTVPLAAVGAAVDPDVLVRAAQACAECLHVRMQYRDRGGRLTERRLEPYRTVSTGRRWYLVARDLDRADGRDDGWRTFRVDRIEQLDVLGHRFVRGDVPDAAALVSAGIAVAGYQHVARVRFPVGADRLRAQIPPTVGVVEDDGPGSSRLTIGVERLRDLAGHLVGMGLPFEVLDPPELRTLLHELGTEPAGSHGPEATPDGAHATLS